MKEVEIHMLDILEGRATHMYRIKHFAERLFIHPTHLSNTIYLTTGKSPCDFLVARLMEYTYKLLQDPAIPIAEVSERLTFDEPTNFTKFFKQNAGITPRMYRKQLGLMKQAA